MVSRQGTTPLFPRARVVGTESLSVSGKSSNVKVGLRCSQLRWFVFDWRT